MSTAKTGVPRTRAAGGRSQLGAALHFMRVLLSVEHALEACSKRMQARYGITAAQRLLIRLIGRYPGICAGDVASIMEVDPSTITPILFRLEVEKKIERKTDPADRRRAVLKLTPKGKKIDALRVGTVEAAVKKALARIRESDRMATERVLQIVAEELDRVERRKRRPAASSSR